MTSGLGPTLERVRRLAESARTSAEVHRDCLDTRNETIDDAWQAGYTLAEIGRAASLSRPTILHILAVEEAKWQEREREAG